VRTTIRNQWTGITDAPSTTILSIYGKQEDNVGLGGVIFNDQYGHTSRAGGAISYAYHLSLNEKIKLSLALSGGFTQFKIDKNGWNVSNPNDPLTQGDVIVETVPDATFGFNLYSKDWYLGVSIPQLLTSNLNLLDNNLANTLSTDQSGTLSRHIYVMGAYNFSASKNWNIEPSLLLKSVTPSPMQFDFAIKATYDKKLWFGADYRSTGDIGALFGYSINDRYLIGYSYDILNSELSDYSTGSHEFMLAIKLKTIQPNLVK
jgi:type IX secretion system PorP/SprF family membrane protein